MRMYHVFAFDRSDPLLATNLTMPQLKALLVLHLRPEASGQDVMAAMGISLATVTGIVDRLAAHGLVTRREQVHQFAGHLAELAWTVRPAQPGQATQTHAEPSCSRLGALHSDSFCRRVRLPCPTPCATTCARCDAFPQP
jgi:MarR family